MTRKQIVIIGILALIGLFSVILLVACATRPSGTSPAPVTTGYEKPDCDWEDRLTGDKDCKSKKPTTPTKKPTKRH